MLDAFRGAGEAAVTIPTMDGSLRPNNLLDRASVVLDGDGGRVTCVASDGENCFVAVGANLYSLNPAPGAAPERLASLPSQISAVAAHRSTGVAVAVPDHGIYIWEASGRLRSLGGGLEKLRCPTGLAFVDGDTLVATNGSATNRPERWRRDLMEKNRSGALWRINLPDGAATLIARDLAFPSGAAVTPSGDIVVSEAWRHRLLLFKGGDRGAAVLDDLPGYPGSLAPGRDGGYWLAVFAPRRQLVEFVLREDLYRRRMMETLEERHWIAPALETGLDYFEPLQSGGVRRLGQVKPWAPTRSYGLLVKLNASFNPVSSYHSRAGAVRHGVTGVAEWRDRVMAACAATNQLLALDPALTEE